MHRSLPRASLWLLADSRHTSKLKEKARSNVSGRMGFSGRFTNSEGYSNFIFREKLVGRSLQVQIVNALRSGQRDQASALLSNLGRVYDSLRAEDFVFVLDYCARSPDPLFVLETWRLMEEKTIVLNRKCWIFIIRALSKGGYLEEALQWLTSLGGSHHSSPSLCMYNIFLNGCTKMQSVTHTLRCLKLMEDQLMGKSEITYWELLQLAVREQNLSAVHEIWKDCNKYYSPSIICIRKFVWSFTKLGDLVSAYDALQHMVALAFRGSFSVRASADGRFQSSRLNIPIPSNGEFYFKTYGTEGSGGFVTSLFEDSSMKTGGQIQSGKEEKHSHLVTPSPMPNATEFIFSATVGNTSPADEERYCRPLQIGPSAFAPAREIGNGCFAAKQELFTDSGMGTMLPEGSGHSSSKDIVPIPVMRVLRWSFNDVILACARSRDCELAEQLFLQMQNLGLEPSQCTYDCFVKAVLSEIGVTYAMKVVKSMEKRNLKPYGTTLAALSVGYSKILELDLAEALLDQIPEGPKNYIHPFNALLVACDVMDQPERAVRVLAKMKSLKIKSDIRTYELLFSLFGNVNAPYEKGNMLSKVDAAKRIHAIEMDMMKNGVQHSCISMENLLRALGAEGMIRELIQYLHVAENLFGHISTYKGTEMYNTVLHALIESNESHTAAELFRNMKLCEMPPNAGTYNIMIDCCSIIRCCKSACSLVSMMLRDGFSPNVCTYTSLIKIVLANEDFNKALQLLDKASAEAIQPDVPLFNTILLEAYLKGRIDMIELIIERMHEEKVQPDPTTCSYAFSAYVECGLFTTAMEALQVLSMRMISEDERVLQEKRTDFEYLVLNEDPEGESQIIEIFKQSEHLAAAILYLRWCAIVGFSISWSPNESIWARRLSSCYGSSKGSTRSSSQ